jgi:lipopolysaccharide export system permease protein
MKKLIFKKLNKDFSIFFLLTITSITLIIWVIQAVNFLDIVIEDGHSFKVYFYYSLLNVPKIISKTLPFVFFLSVIYILLNYENNNQLLIYWHIGITKIRFMKMVVNYSFIYLLIQLIFTSYLVPNSQIFSRSFFKNSDLNLLDGVMKEKKFVDTVKNLTIFIMGEKDGNLEHIFLKENFKNNNYQIINSKSGMVVPTNKKILRLNNGSILTNKNDQISEIEFFETNFNIDKFQTKSIIDIKTDENTTYDLLKCVYFEILKLGKSDFLFNNCRKGNYNDVIEVLYKRLMLPFFIPTLALVASLLILRTKNNEGFNKYLLKIFIFGITLIICAEVSLKYVGISFLINCFLLFSPIIFFTLILLYFMKQLQFKK